MEAVMFNGSLDHHISSPYRSHIKNSNKTNQIFSSRHNTLFSNFPKMGLVQSPAPPFLFHSYPPYTIRQQPTQPPLLPLPAANPHGGAIPRGISCPPPNIKNNSISRARDLSVTPKKPRTPTKSPKKEGKNSPKKSSDYVVLSSINPLGPDPKKMSKDVKKVLPLMASSNVDSLRSCVVVEDEVDVFSGSVVFTISPPPSSLPLPTFSLRPKLGCNVEAAGIDTGATNDLRRLLRLH